MNLKNDIKTAMINNDENAKSVLRDLASQINNKAKELKKNSLTKEEEISVIKYVFKQYSEMAKSFEDAGRSVDEYNKQLKILESYLPKYLDENETTEVVKSLISQLENPTIKDMGKIMLSLKVRSDIDMKLASGIVKKCLN